MGEESRKLTLRCPDCRSHLVVDARTGEVLFHKAAERPPAGGKDFDALLADLETERGQAEEVFEREVAAFKDRDRLLAEKFDEAVKRAREEDDDDRPPPRPFDFD